MNFKFECWGNLEGDALTIRYIIALVVYQIYFTSQFSCNYVHQQYLIPFCYIALLVINSTRFKEYEFLNTIGYFLVM
jgi:hypothetical protein